MTATTATTIRRTCLAGYDEGMLRAFLDGEIEDTWHDELRRHAATCKACSERLARLRQDGSLVQGRLQALGGDGTGAAYVHEGVSLARYPRPPVAVVLAGARAAEAPRPGRLAAAVERWARPVAAWRPLPFAAAGVAAAALLAASFTQPAVQSFAQGVAQSLRVQRVQPVKIDPAALRALPLPAGLHSDPSRVGTLTGSTEPAIRAASVAEAARDTGLALRAPGALPAGLKETQTAYVSEALSFSLTYDGAKLVQTAQELGVSDPALLAELRGLHGQTVKGHVPAAAAFLYGAVPSGGKGPGARGSAGGAPAQSAATSGAGSAPFVALVQLKSPTLDVPPTLDLDRLRDQLLRSGVVPPAVAQQLMAIQDWKTTLPIPVTRGTTREVQVDGTVGTLVTGEYAGPVLLWQKDGALYVLAGTLAEGDLLAAARSLAPAR